MDSKNKKELALIFIIKGGKQFDKSDEVCQKSLKTVLNCQLDTKLDKWMHK